MSVYKITLTLIITLIKLTLVTLTLIVLLESLTI